MDKCTFFLHMSNFCCNFAASIHAFRPMTHTIYLSGRLDTANATAIDEQITRQLAALTETPNKIVFDLDKLDYISSSGLRIILKYKKLYPAMEVINASPDVYNVFQLTGFSRIINITKALRKINLDECQLLARGGNGEVYRINDEEIIKLSLHTDGEERLIEEMNTAREAFILGVPTVISFDTVQASDGRKGIVMEAVNPTTLSSWLCEHPDQMDQYVPAYADIFLTTNAITAQPPQFHSLKERLLTMLEMPMKGDRPRWKQALCEIVNTIPEGSQLIHNDGHPRNVLMCGEGDERQLMLVDMGETGLGHPVMEIIGWAFMMLAPRQSLAHKMAEVMTGMPEQLRLRFMRQVFSTYFKTTDQALLDRILSAAANVGMIKVACLNHSFLPPFVSDDMLAQFSDYMTEHKDELIADIRFLLSLY